ncbi:DUF6912 family protein [Sanguibacter suaedae]|uniref:Uncharacterized protein n=1 Tax=Sanguibacter suaedae TaxID=2795737 RepID=A0A934IE28_9MICO|nr:hypothetical protein [Sanguibacter suaedae]MBI9116040.1 hypothetical protein [Sanguibacter suaedae]
MRLYVPATLDELDTLTSGRITLGPRRAHAATPALVAALAEEDVDDVEEVEFVAQLAAADDSLVAIAANPSVPWLRLVLSVDVPDAHVTVPPVDATADDASYSAVEITAEVTVAVVCAHVDEPDAAGDVQAALSGDDEAIERLADRDLLWYDTTELSSVPRG